GIHAADTPATGPTPPSTDFRDLSEWHCLLLVGVDCCWWVSTLVDTVDPRYAWMDFWAYRRM
ncbi:hypothetical protein ACTUVJ_001911, partial [Stenotrophomonas indicatrix]